MMHEPCLTMSPDEWTDRLAKRHLLEEAHLIAKQFGVAMLALGSRLRTPRISRARAYFCARLYVHHGYRYTEIADLLDRDHTTILHLVRSCRKRVRAKTENL